MKTPGTPSHRILPLCQIFSAETARVSSPALRGTTDVMIYTGATPRWRSPATQGEIKNDVTYSSTHQGPTDVL
jgi:hypothetical protein